MADDRLILPALSTLIGEPLLLSMDAVLQLQQFMSDGDVRAAIGGMARGVSEPPAMAMTDDGFAVISMIGPVTRYDSLISRFMSFIFGVGVSTDSIIDQFAAAFADPGCRGIKFIPDSPGGQAAAINDLGDMIFQMRDVKPVVAYVDNLAASAAYWPTAACSQVIVSPAAFLGSIGVVTAVRKKGDDDDLLEIVSSKSPNKRVDIGTDEGRAQIQARIDALADVFIGAVAKYRGVDAGTVESDFGQGGVLIGQAAVDAGMADMVGDSGAAWAALRELADRSASDQNKYGRFGPSTMNNGGSMDITTVEQLTAAHPTLVEQIRASARAEGATAERDRIKAIDGIDTAANRALACDAIDAAKWDGKTAAGELALSIMTSAGKRQQTQAASRLADASEVIVIQDGGGAGSASEDQERSAMVAAMVGAVNERRGAPKR